MGYRKGQGPNRVNFGECKIDGCNEKAVCKGYCTKHYSRFYYGRPMTDPPKRPNSWMNWGGYIGRTINGKQKYEHRILAEKALGKPLPIGAVVHHMGEPHDNHGFCKLVICPDQAYHLLLHKRMKDRENNQDR